MINIFQYSLWNLDIFHFFFQPTHNQHKIACLHVGHICTFTFLEVISKIQLGNPVQVIYIVAKVKAIQFLEPMFTLSILSHSLVSVIQSTILDGSPPLITNQMWRPS